MASLLLRIVAYVLVMFLSDISQNMNLCGVQPYKTCKCILFHLLVCSTNFMHLNWVLFSPSPSAVIFHNLYLMRLLDRLHGRPFVGLLGVRYYINTKCIK
jgi:hypothetical protein